MPPDASSLNEALERMLGEKLRVTLDFRPDINWSRGAGASLHGQIQYLMSEMTRADGLASSPIALASFNDLVLKTILTGLPHNYHERLSKVRDGAVPAYIRRAEDFMHANAAVPIRMADVAAAARCGERTLEITVRQFRDTTPHAALRAIRLEKVRDELVRAGGETKSDEIARRFGFIHSGRFSAAYRQRYGEAPAETARQIPLGVRPGSTPVSKYPPAKLSRGI